MVNEKKTKKRSATYRKLYIDTIGQIPDNFTIHHIDFNRKNNKIYNLVALPRGLHNGYHALIDKHDLINRKLILDTLTNDSLNKNAELIEVIPKINYYIKEIIKYIEIRNSKLIEINKLDLLVNTTKFIKKKNKF